MIKFIISITLLGLLIFAHPVIARETLKTVQLTQIDQETLNQFHFVFVGGYMNELARTVYFQPLIEELHEQGIENVSTIFPSSLTSVIDTSTDLAKKLFEHYAKYQKPLIVIGHSMGGTRTVAVAIAHPELIEKHILARAVAFQSPISGSAEIRAGLDIFSRMNFGPYRGAYALSSAQVNLVIDDSFAELSDKQQEEVSGVVRYIISSRHTKEMNFGLRRIYESLLRPQTLTDGLVDKYHMFHPEFGSVLIDVEADHMELVVDSPTLAGSSQAKQHAFMTSFLKELVLDVRGKNSQLEARTEKLRLERASFDSAEEAFNKCSDYLQK